MFFLKKLTQLNITIQIAIGILLAVLLSFISPESLGMTAIFGQLFVQSLKAVAPILVLFLVITAISNQGNASTKGHGRSHAKSPTKNCG